LGRDSTKSNPSLAILMRIVHLFEQLYRAIETFVLIGSTEGASINFIVIEKGKSDQIII
jgi:hypothetical protein